MPACATELPPIDPTVLACTDDRPLESGLFPCPESHACRGSMCVPRLGCSLPGSPSPGCPADVSRCELELESQETTGVSCKSGVHTSTSAPAGPTCACPDGTACVVFADGAPSGTYPLYVLPAGGALPVGPFGIPGEVPAYRICARACSAEQDCPPAHSCRAAAVLEPDLLEHPSSGRHTVGVCYPNRLVPTSTVGFVQPDPAACLEFLDCSRASEACRHAVVVLPDHPTAPAGAAWGVRHALLGRCSPAPPGSLGLNIGCTGSAECESGLCHDGRCAAPCDPNRAEEACQTRPCLRATVSRKIEGGAEVADEVFLCER